jgi:hypothetical protein
LFSLGVTSMSKKVVGLCAFSLRRYSREQKAELLQCEGAVVDILNTQV